MVPNSGELDPMDWARSRGFIAGVVLGALAAVLTLFLDRMVFVAPNYFVRWLQAAAFTLLVPGMMVGLALGRGLNGLPLWQASMCNFAFWLGFGWLFGFLVRKLREQIRLLISNS